MAAHTIKPLVTATAVSKGGRNGSSETTDQSVKVNLSIRKEMGGNGSNDCHSESSCGDSCCWC